MPAAHEPLLEVELAVRGLDLRPQPVVGRREEPDADSEALGELLRHRGERLAFLQHSRAQHVQARVLVAEREPGLSPRLLGHRHRLVRVAAHAPPALLVEEAGQRVHDRVEVRGDVQIPHLQVVADVPDRGHVLGPGSEGERVDAARAAETPGQARLSSQRAGGRPGEGPRRREDAPGAPAPARRANAARARHARAGSRGVRRGGEHHGNATRDAGSGVRARRRRAPPRRGHRARGCDRPGPSGRARPRRCPRRDGRLPARAPASPSTRSRRLPGPSPSPPRATAA